MKVEYIEKIRRFNRFYTQTIGLIKKQFLDSKYSLIQARVLFELNRHPKIHAKDLGKKLDLDPTYLSKILKKFEQEKLLTKIIDPEDSRKYMLSLTLEGQKI
ncbi:MAG: MarR family transcriptional regulator, partial [Desulfobacula sp.]|nr:MarR family transcriptional regulator [Desulfobacula sp.]